MELADVLFVWIDDDHAAGTIYNDGITGVHLGSYVPKARHRRNLQRPGKNCHMARAATRIHHQGADLTGLDGNEHAGHDFVSRQHHALFQSHVLQYRTGIVQGGHQAVIQVPKVCRLVPHGRGIDLLEFFDVVAQHHMHRPAGRLVLFLDHFQDAVHQARVLQNHQVGCKYQAVVDAGAGFRNFLDLANFFCRLAHGLQEQLFFGGDPAFGNGLLDDGNFPIGNRENLAHGKARRRRNAHQYNA